MTTRMTSEGLRASWRRATVPLMFACAVAAAVSCGPKTSVTQQWAAPMPTVTGRPMTSMVVLVTNMDQANRRALEDAFVAGMARHGVTAQPSYAMFPGELPEREQAREAVQRTNIDGVLVLTMKGIRERLNYVPGSYGGSLWGGYYGTGPMWGSYVPGYLSTEEVVNMEATLWDARADDRLVWSAMTQTTNPSKGRSFVNSVVKKVVPEITEARIIPPERDED